MRHPAAVLLLALIAAAPAPGAAPASGAAPAPGAPATDESDAAVALVALARACAVRHVAEAIDIGPGLPGYIKALGPARAIDIIGWRVEFALENAAIAVSRYAPRGRVGRIVVEVRAADDGAEKGRQRLAAIADTFCRVRDARRLRYDRGGAPAEIESLDATLRPTGRRIPYNPPPPAAAAPPPGGVRVGLVDTGIDYRLPELARALARSPDGETIGYDYWDLDRLPFDADPVRSPLFPARHGTGIASLLVREAPVARLVPYRYPRPDMGRMAALVENAAGAGVRLINMSLASDDRERWRAFEAAARRRPEILFVTAAGNRGRDIDRRPMYPAALDLDNQIVVTAATRDGRLAAGANWGQRVHLMAAAEGLRAVGFDGAERAVSGSSFAAARITALAACLLAAEPFAARPRSAAALKASILARAGDAAESGRVAHGFIADPTLRRRGACPPAAVKEGPAASRRPAP